MKKIVKVISSVVLISVMLLSFCACGNTNNEKGIWEDATYTQDAEFGNGKKTVAVEVRAEEKSVTFTIKTDKETLGEALIENNLVSGENGAYGLYIKSVNGIIADYDINQSYWAITKNGESVMTGADGVEISDGEHYELIYTK